MIARSEFMTVSVVQKDNRVCQGAPRKSYEHYSALLSVYKMLLYLPQYSRTRKEYLLLFRTHEN